jgi:hypothetical protein
MAQIEIKSRKGTFTTIPNEVLEAAKGYSWHLNKGYVVAYVKGSGGKNPKKILLHQLVIYVMTGKWPEKGMVVDHLNHDKLDNRMVNLRVVTKSVNDKNRNKQEGASSQFQGVIWHKVGRKWFAMAQVRIDGKDHRIYSSLTPDENIAAKCADCIRDLVGGWVPRNYPERLFEEKWQAIGEGQRRQILHSIEKNGIKTTFDKVI